MKRSILAWILIFALIFVFAACADDDKPNESKEGTEQTEGDNQGGTSGNGNGEGENSPNGGENGTQNPDNDPSVPDISWD